MKVKTLIEKLAGMDQDVEVVIESVHDIRNAKELVTNVGILKDGRVLVD